MLESIGISCRATVDVAGVGRLPLVTYWAEWAIKDISTFVSLIGFIAGMDIPADPPNAKP